jgi:hypothetical protein
MGPVYILAAALIVALIALIGVKVVRMISREGFEDMKTNADYLAVIKETKGKPLLSSFCPKNGTLVSYMTPSKEGGDFTWACYPAGKTDVNSIFQNAPDDKSIKDWYINIIAPKGASVTLFSRGGGNGQIIAGLSDATTGEQCPSDAICTETDSLKNKTFASIQVTLPSVANTSTTVTPGDNKDYPTWFGRSPNSASCPTLSPAAAAAAAAVEAKEKANAAKAAAIADATSKAISKSIMNSIADSSPASVDGDDLGSNLDGNMMSVTCPSGDKPKITFVRNTRNAIPETVDVNTLSGLTGADKKCSDSSPAAAMGGGTGGGYIFIPEKDC